MDLTLNVPDELAIRLRAAEDRRPEILEFGLREWLSTETGYAGLGDVLETLARMQSPEECSPSDRQRPCKTGSRNSSPRTAPRVFRPKNKGNGSATSPSSTWFAGQGPRPCSVRRGGERA